MLTGSIPPVSHPTRRSLSHLLPLLLALAVGQADAGTLAGQPGSNGTHGATPGASGGAGGTGESVTVVAGVADLVANAIGGQGGAGGNGAAGGPGQNGGNGGNGGDGGSASASHVIESTAAAIAGNATARGGDGGQPGLPGEAGAGAAPGTSGKAGNGGAAQAIVDIVGTGAINAVSSATGGSSLSSSQGLAGNAAATMNIDGGSGGIVVAGAIANGGTGGATGGNATAEITASGHSLDLAASATGGTALAGRGGTAAGTIRGTAGSGGLTARLSLTGGHSSLTEAGSEVVSRNAFAVQTSGALALVLEGQGGTGGSSSLQPGRGGNADLALLLDDSHATSVTATMRATGGTGGDVLSPGSGTGQARRGGDAIADLQVTAKAPVTLDAAAVGGTGGRGVTGTSAAGGDAGTLAIANASGSADATSTVSATGGAGGAASLPGTQGGYGGASAAWAEAHSGTGTARATSISTGGDGGAATGNATGGDAAAGSMYNGAAGSTAGKLVLHQIVQGGQGGSNFSAGGGAGGQGGIAVSLLTLSDSRAAQIDVMLEARGGKGGYSAGSRSGDGGSAQASLDLTSTKAGASIVANVYADGGTRGSATSGNDSEGYVSSKISALGAVRNSAVADARRNNPSLPYGNGNVRVFGSSQSTMDVHTSAVARTAVIADTTAQARADSVSTGGPATAVATAQGGTVDGSALVRGVRGSPNAAHASGVGLSGTLQATSVTTDGKVNITTTASAPVYGGQNDIRVKAVSGIGDRQVWDSSDNASYASFQPAVPTLFENAPTVGAAFAQTGLVGAGSMTAVGANPDTPGLYHQVTTARFYFETPKAGAMTLGLLDFAHAGAAFHELTLTIFNRQEMFTYTFDNLDATEAFFQDQVLSLGMSAAGVQEVRIVADVVFGDWGSTTFSYALGADGIAPVPEPGTWLMLMLGLAVVAIRQRRRA